VRPIADRLEAASTRSSYDTFYGSSPFADEKAQAETGSSYLGWV